MDPRPKPHIVEKNGCWYVYCKGWSPFYWPTRGQAYADAKEIYEYKEEDDAA